ERRPEHGGQRRKVHPLLASRHGLCINLLRLRAGGTSLLFLDQAGKCLRGLRTHTPYRGNSLWATAECFFLRQRILIRNRRGSGARRGEEIAEGPSMKPFDTPPRLLFERAQSFNVFLDRNANGLRVAAAGRRLAARGKKNRQRQRRRTESCCS